MGPHAAVFGLPEPEAYSEPARRDALGRGIGMADAGFVGRIGAGRIAAPAGMASAIRPKLPFPVLVYLLTVVVPVSFYAGPLLLTGLRAFLILMFVPLTYKLLMGRYDRLYATDVLFLAHTLWAAVALYVNNPDKMVENAGIYAIEFFGGYVLARAYIRGPDEFSALVRAVLLLTLATLPLALHETFSGRPWLVDMIRRIPGITSVAIVNIEQRLGLERVQAVFAHPIHYGLFTSSAFSLTYVALKGEIGDARRIVSAALAGLCCFLALSSGAFLALLMQLFLIGWATVLAGMRRRWVLLLALAVAAYLLVDLLSNRSPIRVFFSYATFSAHNAYWRGIIFEWGMKNVLGDPAAGVAGHPFFGLGLNDWVRPFFMRSGSMDNFWLVQVVRYGLPGFPHHGGGLRHRAVAHRAARFRRRPAAVALPAGLDVHLRRPDLHARHGPHLDLNLLLRLLPLRRRHVDAGRPAERRGGGPRRGRGRPAQPLRALLPRRAASAPSFGRGPRPGPPPRPFGGARPGPRGAGLRARRRQVDPAGAARGDGGGRPRPEPRAAPKRSGGESGRRAGLTPEGEASRPRADGPPRARAQRCRVRCEASRPRADGPGEAPEPTRTA